MAPRVFNVLLGLWLVVSAFLLSHTPAQFHSTWIVGLGITVFALMAMLGFAWTRYLNFGLGLWLFFSALGASEPWKGRMIHNVVVAIAVLALSLFPTVSGRDHRWVARQA